MKLLFRLVLTVFLLALLGLAVFGFLASFEPLPRATQYTWRVLYGGVGAGCILGLIRCWSRPATGGRR